MDKLIDINAIFYVLVSYSNNLNLIEDIINFKNNNKLNIKKLPLKAVNEILDTYNISNKKEILDILNKEI